MCSLQNYIVAYIEWQCREELVVSACVCVWPVSDLSLSPPPAGPALTPAPAAAPGPGGSLTHTRTHGIIVCVQVHNDKRPGKNMGLLYQYGRFSYKAFKLSLSIRIQWCSWIRRE